MVEAEDTESFDACKRTEDAPSSPSIPSTSVTSSNSESLDQTLKTTNPFKKEQMILSKKHRKRFEMMKKQLENNSSSSSSFVVLSGTSSERTSLTNLPKPSNNLTRSPIQSSHRLIQHLENPFLYQEFYEKPQQLNAAFEPLTNSKPLELSDLREILQRKTPTKDETSFESSEAGGISKEPVTKEPRPLMPITTESEAKKPIAESLSDEEEEENIKCFQCCKGRNLEKHRWWNILGVLLIFFGLLAAVLSTICKEVLDHHKKKHSIMFERLTDYTYPQLAAIRTTLVDPDTPKEFRHKEVSDGQEWDLVFSDEFNLEGRTFYAKEDQFFEAVDIHYLATNDLEWYSPDQIITSNGTLKIRLDAFKNNGLFYLSGMLQSWNKLCFTQGYVEISARLPGSFDSKGFWPGLWTLGNLARPGYMATTDGVWPYTYQGCDAGITPNQSSPDGISTLPGQKLNSCTCKHEDHPNRGTGRGAPEFDILEGTFTDDFATIAQTLQVAPFDPWWMPDYEHMLITNKSTSYMNSYVGTSQQEAISVITTLNEKWFERAQNRGNTTSEVPQNFQTYTMEYRSDGKNHEADYIKFGTGSDVKTVIKGSVLHPEGNIGWREISKEPMSLIFNLGLSYSWSNIQWLTLDFPAILEIDYIRIYQPKGKTSVTCDPKNYPTSRYIEKHMNAYSNSNLTSWQDAGYTFPKNRLTHKCKF